MNPIKILYEDLKRVNKPYFESFLKSTNQTLESGWFILGDNVSKFESEFGKIHNNSFCIGVASGLDALVLGLSAFDFPPNSKVLVPSNAYIASILAIIRAGLKPVLVEPDADTYNISVKELVKQIDSKCVAILPVHMYGRLSQMEEIVKVAKKYKLKIIEDCAQSHFSESNKKMAGTFGDIGAFSFYPTKNLGALGDAGAIICKDKNLYEKIKALRNYGSNVKYHNKYIGWNSRLDEIQAAFLLIKLKDYKKVIAHKKSLAELYLKNLKNLNAIKLPQPSISSNVWHIFNILVKDREGLKFFLQKEGIGTEIHYPVAPHNQLGYKSLFKNKYPVSQYIHDHTLSLPISTCHSKSDILKVINTIKKYYKK
jgi:dTDP-4-amino-4,6-dideoxygalactose transaminase